MTEWNPTADPFAEPPKLACVHVAGVELRPGDRVRIRPRPANRGQRTDIFDLALEGKTAVIAAIEEDYENRIHVAVTVDDDPGQDFGQAGKPAHRFFFRPDEIEPIGDAA